MEELEYFEEVASKLGNREILEWIAAEDRMVEELFGAAARDRLRADQLEGRSLILSIAVSLAGLEWSAAQGW